MKPTDQHMYVTSKSCHPSSVKKAIPYGLGIRLRRICESEGEYRKQRSELKQQLRRRGYSSKFIERQLAWVDTLDRNDLLQQRKGKKKKNERTPLIITYTNKLPNLHNIVRKNMTILHQSERMQRVFEQPPIIAYRRDRNLGDILVHGKLNKILRNEDQPTCDKDICGTCERMSEKKQVISADGKKVFNLDFGHFGCKTRNVVYMLYCKICKKPVYVGETGRTLAERITEHMREIRLRKGKPVAEHFNGNGHSMEQLEVYILERICDNAKYVRMIKERDWINRLHTEIPSGLNKKCSVGFLWKDY